MGIIEPEIEDISHEEEVVHLVGHGEKFDKFLNTVELRPCRCLVEMAISHKKCCWVALLVHSANL